MNTIEKLIPIIRQAGSILIKYREQGFETKTKLDKEDFVTTADTESDMYLRSQISALFPDDKILSEENGDVPNDYSGRVWMIDPLDGTRAFVDGHKSFSVMIGLAIDGVPVLGLTFAPLYDELYYAEKEKGAFLIKEGQTQKLNVSTISDIGSARAVDYRRTDKVRDLDVVIDKMGIEFTAVEGTNTRKIGLIVQGLADVVVNTNTRVSKWDFCAPQIILEEAGGKVTDIQGNPIDYLSKGVKLDKSFVATNGLIHNQVLEALNK